MNGHFLSGTRKFNHHWQSGGGGNFAPLTPWYAVAAISAGIRYSVVLQPRIIGSTIEFPVVYKMPPTLLPELKCPIIGIMSPLAEGEVPTECRLGIRKTDKPFSKVIITIKEKKNNTGVDWYIGENFECIYREKPYIWTEDDLKAASITASSKATWYTDSPMPDKAGKLSTLGCIQQNVYRLKDGVEITFENTEGKWRLFELENFECYYVWDPYIKLDKEQYESDEAAKFAKKYSDAMNFKYGETTKINEKILNNLWRWQVSIKAE